MATRKLYITPKAPIVFLLEGVVLKWQNREVQECGRAWGLGLQNWPCTSPWVSASTVRPWVGKQDFINNVPMINKYMEVLELTWSAIINVWFVADKWKIRGLWTTAYPQNQCLNQIRTERCKLPAWGRGTSRLSGGICVGQSLLLRWGEGSAIPEHLG